VRTDTALLLQIEFAAVDQEVAVEHHAVVVLVECLAKIFVLSCGRDPVRRAVLVLRSCRTPWHSSCWAGEVDQRRIFSPFSTTMLPTSARKARSLGGHPTAPSVPMIYNREPQS
jgi:hypothetical protein